MIRRKGIKSELTEEEEEICLLAYKRCPYGRDKLHHFIHTEMKSAGHKVDDITQRGVADWLLKQEFHQVNTKPNRAVVNIKSVSLTATKSGTISLDLFQLPVLANGKKDKGMTYVLVCVDIYTKYLWARAMKDKSGVTTQTAMYTLMRQDPELDRCTTFMFDNGSEFHQLKEVLEGEGKKVINTLPHVPQSNVVERYNSTIKSGINRLVSLTGDKSWVTHLPIVVRGLNKSRSVVTGKVPMSFADKDPAVLERLEERHRKEFGNSQTLKYTIGDKVRLRLIQSALKKKAPFWSTQVYIITSIRHQIMRPFLTDAYVLRKENEQTNIKGYYEVGDLQRTI